MRVLQPFLQWKRKVITYSECESVALGIQHSKRARSFIISSVSCMAVQYFSTLSHKSQIFLENL